MLRRRLAAARGDEQGNIVVAVTVLMVLATLSSALLARSLVALRQVRLAQDYSAALATADAGLADALFQIDQGTPATVRGTRTVGAGTYSYVATRIADDAYEVQSKGSLNGATHAIRATVRRTPRFPYAIFSNQALTFNGNGTANIYSYDVPGGPATGKARVGSNHAVVVNSGAGAGDFQDYYSPAGSCVGCPKPVPMEGPYVLDEADVPAGTTQPCPAGGLITGTVDGRSGMPMVCDENVTLSGTVTIANGPLRLYVTGDHALDMTGSVVNQGGVAGAVQVFKPGSGRVTVGNGAHAADFTGVLYAPRSELTVNGGEKLKGSVVVNSLKVNGAPNFTLAYDTSLGSVLKRSWAVTNWREVPSSSVAV